MTDPTPLSPSAQKVQDALLACGVKLQVIELPDSTRTAQDAAQAIGCQVGQIVKSLVFRRQQSGQPVLILVSGMNRVDESRLAALIGEPIGKADAEFVHAQTGFAIGGVPPLGHDRSLETLIDEDLLQYSQIWAAAGTPNAVFCLEARDLSPLTGGKVVRIK
jgi:prolyl-tRNA editing enzyme YbaK/EbsC (Cys-tRNA(Pro) deacylase)